MDKSDWDRADMNYDSWPKETVGVSPSSRILRVRIACWPRAALVGPVKRPVLLPNYTTLENCATNPNQLACGTEMLNFLHYFLHRNSCQCIGNVAASTECLGMPSPCVCCC
jgi:hypothetical protein